jgi:hypothetical protein
VKKPPKNMAAFLFSAMYPAARSQKQVFRLAQQLGRA